MRSALRIFTTRATALGPGTTADFRASTPLTVKCGRPVGGARVSDCGQTHAAEMGHRERAGGLKSHARRTTLSHTARRTRTNRVSEHPWQRKSAPSVIGHAGRESIWTRGYTIM